MKSIFFKITCLALIFSVSLLNGQTQSAKTTTQVPKPAAATAPKKGKITKKPTSATAAPKPKKATVTTDETVKTVDATTTAPPPVNGNGGMPVMTFEVKEKNFGTIKTGDRPEFTYNFKNTGNAPLDIEIVSGCDCTELEWTRTTVQPGESGFVKAVYNSNKAEHDEHKKDLKKYIDIVLKQTHTSNGYPLVESLIFKVFIAD